MTDLRIEDIPERWRGSYAVYTDPKPWPVFHNDVDVQLIVGLIEEITLLETRNAELEAFASKWGTDSPLSERRALHEASLAYRKAAGVFPNPEGVKAILGGKS